MRPRQRRSFRPFVPGVLAAAMVACGGSSTSPSAPISAAPTGQVAGTVTRVIDGTPIAGASVRSSDRSVLTGPDGSFSIEAALGEWRGVAVVAPGYLTRESSYFTAQSHVRLELIPDSGPFSLGFYRRLVRNGFEEPQALASIRRWTIAPRFYVRTTIVETGAPVPHDIVQRVITVIERSVPELSGGQFSAAAVESGPDTRPLQIGWVRVSFWRDLGGSLLGRASLGGNGGIIDLEFDPDQPVPTPADANGCVDRVIRVAEHELTHTMGFRHTGANIVDFQSVPSAGCQGGPRPEHVRYHAAVAYSRVVGNQDVDVDPLTPLGLQAPAGAIAPAVSCGIREIR